VGSVLNYKLTSDKQSITVGRLLVLVASVVIGMILAYYLSRFLGRRVLPLLGLNRGASSALKSIAFYSLCLIFGVVAFQLLHIPLAAFAFLGGAAAIAVGFGSQDIMNNFMSGIILLSEQPIRVGDVVELSGVQGEVLHIGLRSTRLRTKTNHELIVPNKSLLDEQVTNLTLTDNFVQVFVAVTVDGSVQVQQAKRQMLHIAFFHPLVLKSPRPVVLLKEYDSFYGCMTFEIHFSLQQDNGMKCAMVQSDILEAISELFKAKKEDSDAADSDADTTLPVDAAIRAEVPDVPADAPTSATKAAATMPTDSSALAGLGKLSPLAVLKEIRRSRGLTKAKV
jgi:small-conductance mechanosensitive channel